jgi:DNA-binding NarL/FixJ family response regulator
MRIIIIDDHVLFRRCVVDYLESQPDISVVGETSTAGVGVRQVTELNPDIVLVDVDLGGQSGFAVVEQILQAEVDCAVVMLTASDNDSDMQKAMAIGASGYLLKSIEPPHLCTALTRVTEGALEFPREFLVNHLRNPDATTPLAATKEPSVLSAREIEVLQLITDGLMDKEIADKLCISEHTVKKHEQSLRNKLGVANRLLASLEGIRLGLATYRGK